MSTDLRNIHYREIRDFLNPMRRRVHEKLGLIRRATAKELAEYMNLDKCSVRPRLTELQHLGLAELTGIRRNGEHEFRFIGLVEAQERRQEAMEQEQQLTLA